VNPIYKNLRVGLAGLGLEAYWSQFQGLEARLKGYVEEVEQNLQSVNRHIVNLGLRTMWISFLFM
jgi:L-arabinose isomerase